MGRQVFTLKSTQPHTASPAAFPPGKTVHLVIFSFSFFSLQSPYRAVPWSCPLLTSVPPIPLLAQISSCCCCLLALKKWHPIDLPFVTPARLLPGGPSSATPGVWKMGCNESLCKWFSLQNAVQNRNILKWSCLLIMTFPRKTDFA